MNVNRVVEQIADSGGDFSAFGNANHRARNLRGMAFFGECADGEMGSTVLFRIPDRWSGFKMKSEHAVAKDAGRSAVVIHRCSGSGPARDGSGRCESKCQSEEEKSCGEHRSCLHDYGEFSEAPRGTGKSSEKNGSGKSVLRFYKTWRQDGTSLAREGFSSVGFLIKSEFLICARDEAIDLRPVNVVRLEFLPADP